MIYKNIHIRYPRYQLIIPTLDSGTACRVISGPAATRSRCLGEVKMVFQTDLRLSFEMYVKMV